MAEYTFTRQPGKSFNQVAKSSGVTYVMGDTAHYVNEPEIWVYDSSISFWLRNTNGKYSFEQLQVGPASSFRENLNSNFEQIGNNSSGVQDNVYDLKQSLAPVAFSGSSNDITETTSRQFVSTEQKNTWSEQLFISLSGGNVTITQRQYNTSTGQIDSIDVTSDVKEILEYAIPSKTSDLTNDAGFVTNANYSSPIIKVWENKQFSNPVSDSQSHQGFSYKLSCSLTGVNTNMIPTVIFSQTDVASGKYCQICETGTNVVYIWSTSNNSVTVPVITCVSPSNI